jgi:sigma-E factor negative regulatory protein RseA
MEKISQLMDGELGEQESRVQIRRLEQDEGLVQTWATYHLIRDVLRDEAGAGSGLAQRVCERLQREPTVLAPRLRLAAGAVSQPLRIAAAVAGVAVVAWLAFSTQAPKDKMAEGPSIAQTQDRVIPSAPPVVTMAKAEMNRYLQAHQEFSPTTAMQGVGSYIRTVSNEDSDSPR